VLTHRKETVQRHSRVFCGPETALQEDKDSDNIRG